jgi:AcrR family transcriptional regulator
MSKIHLKQIQRRSEIIDKVMKLTEKTPFEDLSIRDICEGTGISVGSFYHYFREKGDLVCGLMELIDASMDKEVIPQLTNESELENLRFIARGFARHIQSSGIEKAKLIAVCKPTDADEFGVRRPTFRAVESVVMRGQNSGEFKLTLSPGKTTDMILTAITGVTIDWSRRDGNFDLIQRMDEYTAFFFRALLC